MTKFDEFIKSVFEEGLGNMGTGGISNMGGSGTKPMSTNNVSTGSKPVSNGVQMKHSGTASKPMNPSAVTSDPNELAEFQSILDLQTKDENAFNNSINQLVKTDPKKFNRFMTHSLSLGNQNSVAV